MGISGISSYNYNSTYAFNKVTSGNKAQSYEAKSVTSQKGLVLHVTGAEGETAVGSKVDQYGNSITVYKPEDFDSENPIYHVKMWDAQGNITDRMIDISEIDVQNSDSVEMWTYASHLTSTGEYKGAQQAFVGAEGIAESEGNYNMYDKQNWMSIVNDAMSMQYSAGNMEGYLEFKKFYGYLEDKSVNTQSLVDEIKNRIAEMADKLEKGETEETFQIGGQAFTLKEWDKLMSQIDKSIEDIKESAKEEMEKAEEEAEKAEQNKQDTADSRIEAILRDIDINNIASSNII